MATTLDKIAREAQVSVSTVSRALNGHPAISPDTIQRVRLAADRLHYRRRRSHGREWVGRLLSGSRVALISLGMDRSLITLPVVAGVFASAEAGLSEAGAGVQIAHVPDLDQPPTALLRAKLDGAILCGALQGDWLRDAGGELLEKLRKLPTVWLLGRPQGLWGDSVGANDYEVGNWAAEYLARRGHRRVALLNPKPDHILFRRREDGFVATALRLGLETRSYSHAPPSGWRLPLAPPLDVATVQNLVDEMLADAVRPSAVFAVADSIAVLVYRALAVRDLRVGRDISVISGNHDESWIAGLHPRLTTCDIHPDPIGRLAVNQLAMRLSRGGEMPESELMISPTPVEAESVATIGHRGKTASET